MDSLRRAYLFGMGLMYSTRDKVEAIVDDMIKRGELAAEKRSDAINEIINKGAAAEKELSGMVRGYVKHAIEDMGLVGEERFLELQQRVADLQLRVDLLQSQLNELRSGIATQKPRQGA